MVKYLLLAFSLSLLSACVSNSTRQTADSTPNTKLERPDEQSLSGFCEVLSGKLSGDADTFILAHFDEQKFSDNVFLGVRSNTRSFRAIKARMQESIKDLPRGLVADTRGSKWDVIRFSQQGNSAKCLLRNDFISSRGIQLIEFYLYEASDGIRIFNWKDQVKNVLTSDMMRSVALDLQAFDEKVARGQVEKGSQDEKDIKTLFTYIIALKNQDVRTAIEYYKQLPPNYKNNPVYGLRMVILGGTKGGKAYQESLQLFYDQFKNDERFDLLFMDYYFERKQYQKALESIESAEKRIGPDTGFYLLKAVMYQEMGQTKKFYAMCLKLINHDVGYENTYWLLFDELVRQRQYEDAVLVLDVMHKAFSYSFSRDRFERDPDYAQLIRTNTFNQWIKSL